MPMYDFVCDVCGENVEVMVPYADRGNPIFHKDECEGSRCLGMLHWAGITGFTLPTGKTFLDGRHQTKAIMYDGERKVGYVDGHFGKSAKRNRR